MNLFSKPLEFTRFFNRVIAWNATARKARHDFSQEAKDFQLTLVEEEFKELIEAYKTLDKVEALDALCDVFVTAAYLYFQEAEGEVSDHILISVPSSSIDYSVQLNYSVQGLKSGREALKDVCALLYQFDGCVTKALDEVLDSNDSKFPKVEIDKFGNQAVLIEIEGYPSYVSPEEMCMWIELQGVYTDVTFTVVPDGDIERFVFKSDKGKIVKPASFFQPNLAQYC